MARGLLSVGGAVITLPLTPEEQAEDDRRRAEAVKAEHERHLAHVASLDALRPPEKSARERRLELAEAVKAEALGMVGVPEPVRTLAYGVLHLAELLTELVNEEA